MLHDEVEIALVLGYLEKFNYVGVIDGFEYCNFLINHLEILFSYEFFLGDCFYCYFLPCGLMDSQLNCPEAACPQLRHDLIIFHPDRYFPTSLY